VPHLCPQRDPLRTTKICGLRCLNAGNPDHSESFRGPMSMRRVLLHTDFLGLDVGFDLGWVARFQMPRQRRVGVQLVVKDATASIDSHISVGVSRRPRGVRAGDTAGVRDRSSADHGGVGPDTLLHPIATRRRDQYRRARLDAHRAARSRLSAIFSPSTHSRRSPGD